MKWLALFVFLSLPFAVSGQDQNVDLDTGQGLYSLCSKSANESPVEAGLCHGYIVGASDAYEVAGLIDRPVGVTNGQSIDVVKKYLTDHPAIRNQYSSVLVLRAMAEAFPPHKK